jgi:signal transduction histidine kinase
MTLAKADQGIVDTHLSEVRLDQLVEELYDDSTILAEPKSISVTVKERQPITIVGDRVKLRQLVLNLITNAIRYTPTGGAVSLSVARENGTALFEVADTGIGIPPGEIGKIFDRFYRVDKARSRELGGSGLGLSIAKLIAEQHRGRISVASEPHRGSTFTVHLPIS